MIVDLQLTYPSGLATAVLINGFHTQGDKMAKYTSFSVSLTFLMKLESYKESNLKKRKKKIMQEASSGVHEILFSKLLVGFLQVVFQWKRGVWWVRTVPYFWIESVEANVCNCSFLCFFELNVLAILIVKSIVSK
jgi:uncharacterized oligopeptide transporter (OPT) family protein